MLMTTDKTKVVLPSGLIMQYQKAGIWVKRKPSLWQDFIKPLFSKEQIYLHIAVAERFITPDARCWYCESNKSVREVVNVYV